MADPLVSVKMITFNHAPYIASAIDGVLMQRTNFSFELVIGEDCSTDGTREIVFEYQQKYPLLIRVITSGKNVGGSKNGYRTSKACLGKYIAVCEGDDYWHDARKLQMQLDYLESHPEYGLVYSSYDLYFPKSKRRIRDFIRYNNWKMPENPNIMDILEGKDGMRLGILPCTAMYRKDLWEKIVESDPYLHKSGAFIRGDTQFMAEMTTLAKVHFIPESLATYNQTEESATRSRDVKKVIRLVISDVQLSLYLCKKYNLGARMEKIMEEIGGYALLRLAFHTRDSKMAEEGRKKLGKMNLKEWFLFCGAKSMLVYYPIHLAFLLRKWFKIEGKLGKYKGISEGKTFNGPRENIKIEKPVALRKAASSE